MYCWQIKWAFVHIFIVFCVVSNLILNTLELLLLVDVSGLVSQLEDISYMVLLFGNELRSVTLISFFFFL